jgi:hypothetical protein
MAMLPNCFKINNIKYKDFKEQRATFHRDPEYVAHNYHTFKNNTNKEDVAYYASEA